MNDFRIFSVQESGLRSIAYGGILHMKEWAAEHYPEVVDCDDLESMRLHIARKLIELLPKGETDED